KNPAGLSGTAVTEPCGQGIPRTCKIVVSGEPSPIHGIKIRMGSPQTATFPKSMDRIDPHQHRKLGTGYSRNLADDIPDVIAIVDCPDADRCQSSCSSVGASRRSYC